MRNVARARNASTPNRETRETRETRERPSLHAYITSPPDPWLFAVVAILAAIGMVMIFSASSATAYADHHDPAFYVKRQFVWFALGSGLAYGAYRIDYLILKRFAPYLFWTSVAALAAVLVPHVGLVVNGAHRWLGAGSLSIQPSEFAKLTLVIFLAAALAARGERIRTFTKGLVPLAFIGALACMLVFKEPDVGTASLLAMTMMSMFFAAGARLAHLLAFALVTIPPAVLMIAANPYQRARILVFLDPWKDPQNTGFHIVQSLYALGSGGWLGVGLGDSRAKFFFLPEQYTDFIFSILGEELGLFGTLTVVLLFMVLAYRAIKIALAAPDRFGFLLAIGCAAMITIQAFVNIGVVSSSWPVTGVPLPFISFGGSSLVVNLIAVALIANVGRRRRVDP